MQVHRHRDTGKTRAHTSPSPISRFSPARRAAAPGRAGARGVAAPAGRAHRVRASRGVVTQAGQGIESCI